MSIFPHPPRYHPDQESTRSFDRTDQTELTLAERGLCFHLTQASRSSLVSGQKQSFEILATQLKPLTDLAEKAGLGPTVQLLAKSTTYRLVETWGEFLEQISSIQDKKSPWKKPGYGRAFPSRWPKSGRSSFDDPTRAPATSFPIGDSYE